MNLFLRFLSRLFGLFRLNVWASLWGMVIVASSILLFTVHMIEEETEYAHKQTQNLTHFLARSIATSVAHGLREGSDGHNLQAVISDLLDDDEVLSIHIFDAHGTPLLQAGDDPLDETVAVNGVLLSALPETENVHAVIHQNRIVHWHPVTDGDHIGWVRLDYSLQAVDEFQRRFFWDNFFDGLLVAVFGGVVLLLVMWPPIGAFYRGIRAASTLAGRQGQTFDLGLGTREVRDLERVLNETSERLHTMTRERVDTADLLATVLDNAADAVIAIDRTGIIQTFNAQAERMFNYSESEVVGRNVKMLMPEPYRSEHDAYLARFDPNQKDGLLERRVELEGQRKDGSVFPMELGVGMLEYQGQIHFVGTVRDTTQRRIYERALDESHRSLLEAQQLARLGRWEWFIEEDKIDRDEEMYRALGMDASEMSQSMEDLMDTIHPEDRELFRLALMRALEGEDREFDCEYRIIMKDETVRTLHTHGLVRHDEAGKPERLVGTIQDVSERRSIEDALRRSEKSMSTAQRIAGFGSWQWNIETGGVVWSDMAYQIYGINPGEKEPSYDLFFETVHPDDRAEFEEIIVRSVEDGVPYTFEHRIQRKDGEVRTVREVGEIAHDEAGRPILMTGTVLDITGYRAAEEQKQQSQKMAAIGQLASGVAHEFNNLLVAIGGFARMAQKDPSDIDRVQMCMDEVVVAADRASELTDQLLTFSRRRDTTAKVVKADEVVGGLKRLLGPVLGAQVDLQMELSAGDVQINVDPGQTAQAIMNLAINGRDAMPEGGKLTIHTWVGEVPPSANRGESQIKGPAVCIAVSDTGTGIDPANLDRLFEPFFTTKEEGKGTGLGLAMVYTTASDAGGFVDVKSVVGEGTTFYYYLPSAGEAIEGFDVASPVLKDKTPVEDRVLGILVVEDDPSVAQLATMSLEEIDYFVFTAEDGAIGRNIVTEGFFRIDLMIIDVELPGINGMDLARELTATHPDLKILLMSGLDVEGAAKEGGDELPWPFLKKPFKPEELQAVVRDILEDNKEDNK